MNNNEFNKNKLIITNPEGKDFILSFYYQNDRLNNIIVDKDKTIKNGDVFLGRISEYIKNIDAYFVSLDKENKGFMKAGENDVFFTPKNQGQLKCGSEVVVQVKKEAFGTKEALLTSKIMLDGRKIVLTYGNPQVCFSKKITDNDFKDNVKNLLSEFSEKNIGFIVRTNAYNDFIADGELSKIKNEADILYEKLNNMFENSKHLQGETCLLKNDYNFMKILKALNTNECLEIITDNKIIFESLSEYLKNTDNSNIFIRMYEDEYSLWKLYSLDNELQKCTERKVWLKSGANIVIDTTEAMIIVDVNTGKNIKKAKTDETFLSINTEAIKEALRQITIRNMSGIIILDFINMANEECYNKLGEIIKKEVSRYSDISFHGFTKLGLGEFTRKKSSSSLLEQL